MNAREIYSQFKDEDHFIFIFKGIMKIDQLAVMQMVHDVNLLADKCLLHGMANWNELSRIDMAGLELAASVNNSKGTSSNLLEDVIVIIHTVLGLDLHGLRNVLCIDVKDKLIIILNLTLLASDLLSCVRINLVVGSVVLLLENSLGLAASRLIA